MLKELMRQTLLEDTLAKILETDGSIALAIGSAVYETLVDKGILTKDEVAAMMYKQLLENCFQKYPNLFTKEEPNVGGTEQSCSAAQPDAGAEAGCSSFSDSPSA